MAGRFIVVEGLDRAGKSTQCARLAAQLRLDGRDVVEMKFPDRTTAIGQMINTYLTDKSYSLNDEAIHLLFSANRWELAPKISQLLADGKDLVVDRYTYSGVAFSSAKGLDLAWCQAPDIGLPKPDIVLFLDVDEATAARRGGYGDERYEVQSMQSRVRTQFEKLRDPSWSWILANGSLDDVSRQIYDAVKPLFS